MGMTNLCFCCSTEKERDNKFMLLIGNNDKLKSLVFEHLTGQKLDFKGEPSIQKQINRKTKRIYCIAIAHSEANLPIVDIQINYASGIILVLDAEKDEDQDQVSLYLQHMRIIVQHLNK